MVHSVTITKSEVLSDNWYVLKKITYDYSKADGTKSTLTREVYDRGNGAVILLYNTKQQTVILTKQFRLPTFLNGNETGMLIEACAGLLEIENPEECIKRETEEETGYQLHAVKKVFEAYMSPGAVTEILHFFIAEYTPEMKISEGGGLLHEEENIEVIECSIEEAMSKIETGEIKDAKTILLLQYVKLHHII